jgi:hypothetical protein
MVPLVSSLRCFVRCVFSCTLFLFICLGREFFIIYMFGYVALLQGRRKAYSRRRKWFTTERRTVVNL